MLQGDASKRKLSDVFGNVESSGVILQEFGSQLVIP